MASKRKKKQPTRGRRRFRASSVLLGIGAGCLVAVVLAVGFLSFRGGGTKQKVGLRQTPVVTDEMEVTVATVDNDYAPRHLTVPKGATVTWTLKGDLPHTITDADGARRFDSGTLRPGESFKLTFEQAGRFDYFCTLHHAMQGTVVVTD
jgi:plastocyanin